MQTPRRKSRAVEGKGRQPHGGEEAFLQRWVSSRGEGWLHPKITVPENRDTSLCAESIVHLRKTLGLICDFLLFIHQAGFSSATWPVCIFGAHANLAFEKIPWPHSSLGPQAIQSDPEEGTDSQGLISVSLRFLKAGWLACICVQVHVVLTNRSPVFRLIIPNSGYSGLCYSLDYAANKHLSFSFLTVALLLKGFLILCDSVSGVGHNRTIILID